jgi:hypothetical protein
VPEFLLPRYAHSGYADLSVKVRLGACVVTGQVDDPLRYGLSEELRDWAEKGELLLDERKLGTHYLVVLAFVET